MSRFLPSVLGALAFHVSLVVTSPMVTGSETLTATAAGQFSPPTIRSPALRQAGKDATAYTVPAPALAAGYLARTFGPNMTLGENWHQFSFYGVRGVITFQNADGSITIPRPSGDNFGAHLCTATPRPSRGPQTNWSGKVFGGGGYFEAIMSFTGRNQNPGPSFWANDIENMSASTKEDLKARQWPGQSAGYGNWVEVDVAEFNAKGLQYGTAIHNWYDGRTLPPPEVNTGAVSGSPISVPVGTDFSKPHRYGFLWLPATPTTQGQASWYFDDIQVGKIVTWNQWKASFVPPPVVGTSAFSVLDKRHLALILGTGSSNEPLTVYSVSVWQRSSAQNVTR